MIASLPSIARSSELMRLGKIRPLDLVDFCLARINRFDAQVRAWVCVDEDGARREAQRLGELVGRGELLGPLHGIPVGIKDIIDVRGMPTQAGSPLRADHSAKQDAPVVAALRAAGAIVLGKTVTTELAYFDPPPTRNPWNLNHTPGGSSSGSAAAVALGMCPAALGTQTGGSIVRPASYCGVAGMKPRFGQVSLEGVVPLSPPLDHLGPIAPCVDDLAVVWAVIVGAADGVHARSRSWLAEAARGAPPTLSVIEEFFMEQASSAVRRVTQQAIEQLQKAGASLKSMGLPSSFADVHVMHRRMMAAHAAQYHRHQFLAHRSAFGHHVAALIDEGLALSGAELDAALRHQQQFREEIGRVLNGGTVAVTPSTPTTAPARLDTTGDPQFNSPWSYAGAATVTLPCGLADDGMPCGLQLISAGDEFDLLTVAAWCERILAFEHAPPLTGGRPALSL